MNDYEKLDRLKTVSGESNEALLLTYLDLAKEAILRRVYPYGDSSSLEIPNKYDGLHIEIANFLFSKRGAEGEKEHTEDSVNRIYEGGYIPESMLKGISPFCGVMK